MIWPVKNISGGSSKFKAPDRALNYSGDGVRMGGFSVFSLSVILALIFFNITSLLLHSLLPCEESIFLLLCVVAPFETSESPTVALRHVGAFVLTRLPFPAWASAISQSRCRARMALVWIPHPFLLWVKRVLCKTRKPYLWLNLLWNLCSAPALIVFWFIHCLRPLVRCQAPLILGPSLY